ncbi:MAG: hypothetical protein RR837_03005 [Bacteroidales bacterium]
MKRSILIPGVLTIYLIVMAVIGWPHYSAEGKYLEYAGLIGATLIVIVLLYFLLRRRDRMRREFRKQKDASLRRRFRDDNIR